MQNKTAQTQKHSDGINQNQHKRSPDYMPFNPQSQCAELLSMLRAGSVTHHQAAKVGILGFSARINDLRRAGFNIVSTPEKRTNKYGKTVTINRYTLINQTEPIKRC